MTSLRVKRDFNTRNSFSRSGGSNGARSRWEFSSWTLPDGERYTVLREHARGGLGRIFEATDRRLNRSVALKELIRSGDEEDEARFVREAMITARLEHPAIVPIHDVGRWPSGQPYIAMKMISGRSLREVIAEKNSLEQRLELLPNVIAVADAMAYAHSKRVIHRDLNPSNILIGAFGETVIIDWGLVADLTDKQGGSLTGYSASMRQVSTTSSGESKRPRGQPTLTLTGVVLGTAEYMPLEQARGELVDERADVYAIGAILYHLLTATPPYEGENSNKIVEKVLERPPEPIDRREPRLSPALVTIVRKAMAREARDRYRTAKELADDLKRFQTGKLVSAHSYTVLGLIDHRLRTYRLPLKAVALGLLALIVAAGLSFRRVIQQKLAQAARNERILVEARAALDTDPTASLAWLKHYPVNASNWETVREIALQAIDAGPARRVFRADFSYPSYSPDGRRLVLADPFKNIQVWDTISGKLLKQLSHNARVNRTIFSPNGMVVLFYDWLGSSVYLWDVDTGFLRVLQGHRSEVNAAAFSPDGKWVVSVSADKTVRLWSTSSDEARVLGNYPANTTSLAFSNHSQRFATASDDGQIRLWDSFSGSNPTIINTKSGEISTLAFSGDDRILVWSGKDGSIEVWNLLKPERSKLVGHSKEVTSLSFSTNGKSLASASLDGTVRLWNVLSGESKVLSGHRNEVWTVAFSPDGRLLASGGKDGILRLWEVSTQTPLKGFRGHQTLIYDVRFSPDGQSLMSSGSDGTVRPWSFQMDSVRVFSGHTDDIYSASWSPSGQFFATASKDRTVRLWDVATGNSVVLLGHKDQVLKTIFSPDGTKIASASMDHTVRVWSVDTGKSLLLSGHENTIWDIAFSATGELLASASLDGTIRLWDLRSGGSRVLRGHQGEVHSVLFSPDGTSLASGSSDGTVRLWKLASGWSRVLRGHQDVVYRVAFSPDGKLLASGSDDQTLRIWNLETGDAQILRGHKARLRSIGFLPDGRRIFSASDDKTVRVWNIEQGTGMVLRGHKARIYYASLSPDGRLLASAGADHTVRVWDLSSNSLIAFYQHEDDAKWATFSPDGRYLVSVSDDQTARLWRSREIHAIPNIPREFRVWLDTITSFEIDPAND